MTERTALSSRTLDRLFAVCRGKIYNKKYKVGSRSTFAAISLQGWKTRSYPFSSPALVLAELHSDRRIRLMSTGYRLPPLPDGAGRREAPFSAALAMDCPSQQSAGPTRWRAVACRIF
jgi:hypothetical protein